MSSTKRSRVRAQYRSKAWCWLVTFALISSATGTASAEPLLLMGRENDPELRVVDATNASTVSTHALGLSGETVLGASGLASHPTSGDVYALLWLQGQAGRELVVLDPVTKTVSTRVGNTGDWFTALAFDDTGTLYGLTHDEATVARTLFTLDPGDASSTVVADLGSLGLGEALGSDPSSGLLYHASGEPGGGQIFESIDPDGPFSITSVPTSGDPVDEVLGLAPNGTGGLYLTDLLGSGGVSDLYEVSVSGVVTRIGGLGFSDARGVALLPEPGRLTGLLAAGLALGFSRRVRQGRQVWQARRREDSP